jgi:hypothetical protein
MKKVYYYGIGVPAGIAASLLYAGSPLLVREFDIHDAPESPPLAALASLVSTATGGIVYDNMGDTAIDVRPLHRVEKSRGESGA